jgi:PEP-CTERM motif
MRTMDESYIGLDNVSVSAIPEPAVWAMLLVGFGMLGGALRLRPDPAMTVV